MPTGSSEPELRHRRQTRLVVNADDFGLTEGVCRGIMTAHSHGIVTSTSVLTVAPAFERCAPWLRDSDLGIGLHLCAVGEDPPLLTATEIPTLVDRRGRFPMTWRAFCRRAAAGRIDPGDLRRELDAQVCAALRTGLVLDHIDSHQNLHLWPSFREVALQLATHYGVGVLRVAGTQRWTPTALGVRALGHQARRQAENAGVVVPDRSYGLDTAGANDLTTLIRLIAVLRAGRELVDLTVHPGAPGDVHLHRYRWNYQWAAERDALCQPELADAVEQAGLVLTTFADALDPRRAR